MMKVGGRAALQRWALQSACDAWRTCTQSPSNHLQLAAGGGALHVCSEDPGTLHTYRTLSVQSTCKAAGNLGAVGIRQIG